jgi:hypothetical protein
VLRDRRAGNGVRRSSLIALMISAGLIIFIAVSWYRVLWRDRNGTWP